ncbi:hypothetical protein AB0I51_31250 [Streptomyces sp. NPDC050549]|uniref:hypothetical protein n=1 Tax=Streptomyces sp. NPDC050549 TaxID=3155406 RepID=UPI003417CEDD
MRDQLVPQLPDGVGVFEAADLGSDVLGKPRVPDLVVTTGGATVPLPAVEVVSSSNPRTGYEDKSRDHPATGIPHCLIVDPRDGGRTYQWQVETGGLPLYPRTDVTLASEWDAGRRSAALAGLAAAAPIRAATAMTAAQNPLT